MFKIAITGASGYLGSVLISARGFAPHFEIDLLDIRAPQIPLPPKHRFLMMDLSDATAMEKRIPEYDVIIHLAGLVGFPACQREPERAMASNLLTTEHLMRFKRRDTPLLLASTGSNYGGAQAEVNESTPLLGSSWYSQTKIEAEKRVGRCPRSIIYRFSSSFGLSPAMRDDLLVHDFVRRAVAGETLSLFESHYYRQFIHVRDMVRSLHFALANLGRMGGQVFNVGGASLEFTKKELAQRLQQFIPFSFRCEETGTDPEKRHYRVSFAKLAALGFQPEMTLEAAMPELLTHYRERLSSGVRTIIERCQSPSKLER